MALSSFAYVSIVSHATSRYIACSTHLRDFAVSGALSGQKIFQSLQFLSPRVDQRSSLIRQVHFVVPRLIHFKLHHDEAFLSSTGACFRRVKHLLQLQLLLLNLCFGCSKAVERRRNDGHALTVQVLPLIYLPFNLSELRLQLGCGLLQAGARNGVSGALFVYAAGRRRLYIVAE